MANQAKSIATRWYYNLAKPDQKQKVWETKYGKVRCGSRRDRWVFMDLRSYEGMGIFYVTVPTLEAALAEVEFFATAHVWFWKN